MLSVLSLLTVLSLLVLVAVGGSLLLGNALSSQDPLRWHKLGGFIAVLLLGWVFILWSNKFHVTAPVVMVCLSFLAISATVINLWRTGAATVAPPGSIDEQWGKPIGARGELEKEKRTLLKAIKEAEFDHAMGKLSKADVDQLVRAYRARAIEVIKALDELEGGDALDTKAKIAREVKARLELAAADKPSQRAKNAAEKKLAKAEKAKAPKTEVDATAARAEEKAADDAADAADDADAADIADDAKPATAVAAHEADREPDHEIDLPGSRT